MECNKCPRRCRSARLCGVDGIVVAKIMKHYYEEPIISGKCGSGAVFFSGCNLRCCYCQNKPISHGVVGKRYSPATLAEELLRLNESGVHNINLVTAAHIVPEVARTLELVKDKLTVPVVYNSSGYEGDLDALNGLIDVYLPDFKYFSSELAARFSKAPDYPPVAKKTLAQMYAQVGAPKIEDGLIKRGLVIRHLVLPGCRLDSMAVLKYISEHFSDCLVSIMSQYTPDFNTGDKSLSRRITSFEYNSVIDYAEKVGLKGFMQDRSSASTSFTPDWNE